MACAAAGSAATSARRSASRARERDDLYYTLLLKDLGCSSNAARICELYQADDRAFKQGYKTVGTSLAATLHFVASRTATAAPLHRRAAAIGNILKNGDDIAQELIVSRCTRGADIARSLRFDDDVATGIYHLDEHWDGSGRPGHLRGDAIPLASRIALLAQVVDVFHSHAGKRRRDRRGRAAQRQLARPGARRRLRPRRRRPRLLERPRLAVPRRRACSPSPRPSIAARSTTIISTTSPPPSAR